jgi:molybdopterin synthase sulfur carrier subunit
LRYFAWVREKTGLSSETIVLDPAIKTVSDLVMWLKSRGPEFESAFAAPSAVRAAIDKVHAKPSAKIAGAREIAFFPPVTGG